MMYLKIFSLLLAVSLAAAFNLRLQGPGNATLQRKSFLPATPGMGKDVARIINGANAVANEIPYIVGLDFVVDSHGGDRSCGGALISHEWILTAAHCTVNAESVKVLLGMRIRGSPTVFLWLSSRHIVPHNDYDPHLFKADIALINIEAVTFNAAIDKIDLPRYFADYVGHSAIASGWGSTSHARECERSYPDGRVYPGKLCTAGYSNGAICTGDSGGPLVTTVPKVLIGITSAYHRDGCKKGHPDTFTRVHSYLPWIHQKTGIPI